MNPQDNVQQNTTTNPQTTYPNNPPHDPNQQGLSGNVPQTQFPQPPMGYAPHTGMPQHGMHPGMVQGQFGPPPVMPTAPGVHYSYPVQHNYAPIPGAVGAVPPPGGYPQNMYAQAPFQQPPPVSPPVSGTMPAQGSFPQNAPPQQSTMAAPPPPVYYGAPQHYAHAYPPYYHPQGHYTPYPATQFAPTMGSVETSVYPPPETTQTAESVNKAPSEDVEVEQNTIQEQQVPNPSLTPQLNHPPEQLLSHPLPNPSTIEDAPIVDKRKVENTELVQEMNNVTLEELPSLPVSSSDTLKETERPVSQANPEENSLVKVFVSDLTNRLMKLSKEDQTEVIQNALSRLGLHECIDALVEEFGMKDLTEATTGTNLSNF